MTLPTEAIIAESDRCVACGLCLPHCPTYRLTGSEADSPRGRIQLMRAVAQEVIPNNARFKAHIDLCLSCRSCESACPNSVNYGSLIDATRAHYTPKKRLSRFISKPVVRARHWALLLTWPLWLVQRLGLQPWLQRLIPAARMLPKLAMPTLWEPAYKVNPPQAAVGTVSLFLGCASNALDSQTLKATIYVLNQLGLNVLVPSKQTCCGSIARQAGDALEAQTLVETNRASFKPEIPMITVASGCGAGLKDYLPDHTVHDISHFLLTCDWSGVTIAPLPARIYVQDPCTLRNVLKSHQAVYQLLQKIPEAEITPLVGNSQCCGGAGAYSIQQPKMANQLRADKLHHIKSQGVAVLATSNIGCSLHLAQGLREAHLEVQVLHPVQLIAQQMGWQA